MNLGDKNFCLKYEFLEVGSLKVALNFGYFRLIGAYVIGQNQCGEININKHKLLMLNFLGWLLSSKRMNVKG